jgi:hypothetical protein
MPLKEKRSALRAIWRDKMHVEPRALQLLPAHVARSYEHIWQPAQLVMAELEVLPLGLLRLWQGSERGHVVFTHRPSGYQPGRQPWHDTTLESACYLSLTDLREDKRHAMRAVFNLLDHLLGSDAREGGPWLSDGAGSTPALRDVGARFAKIYALGYGQAELGAETTHDYLAQTLWLYLRDPRQLNVLDPLVHKLYHNTLMNEGFWQAALNSPQA